MRLTVLFLLGVVAGFATAIATTACGDSSDTIPPPGASSSSGGFAPPDGGTIAADAGTPPDDGCTAAAKLVYVISEEKDLYSFTPNTLTFTKIGPLDCPGAVGIPVSMAVDRTGTAWINYASGALYKASTTDGKCADSGFAPNQAGFAKFGMAFVSDAAGSTNETLFISGLLGTTGKGLGKIDTKTLTLTMIHDYPAPLTGVPAELTGNGAGQLFGFFNTSPATLAQIDGTTAVTSNSQALTTLGASNAFAFSFWGGDFWLYTTDGTVPSKVTQRKSTGETAVVKADVGGFRIVGAGVSTCAPLSEPK
jgi:hypothetical protein